MSFTCFPIFEKLIAVAWGPCPTRLFRMTLPSAAHRLHTSLAGSFIGSLLIDRKSSIPNSLRNSSQFDHYQQAEMDWSRRRGTFCFLKKTVLGLSLISQPVLAYVGLSQDALKQMLLDPNAGATNRCSDSNIPKVLRL